MPLANSVLERAFAFRFREADSSCFFISFSVSICLSEPPELSLCAVLDTNINLVPTITADQNFCYHCNIFDWLIIKRNWVKRTAFRSRKLLENRRMRVEADILTFLFSSSYNFLQQCGIHTHISLLMLGVNPTALEASADLSIGSVGLGEYKPLWRRRTADVHEWESCQRNERFCFKLILR